MPTHANSVSWNAWGYSSISNGTGSRIGLGVAAEECKLRGNPCVGDSDYRAARGLDRSVMRALTQEWVKNHENIFVLGPTGEGKSFIARHWHKRVPGWIFRVLHEGTFP